MHFASLFLAALPLTFAFSDPEVHARSRSRARSPKNNELAKRQTYSGRATFYATGLGACGWYNDYIVALNTAQYGSGYPGPECGRSITISANGVQVVAQIADQCPSCGYGDLDLSPSLFNRFASPDAGVFQMSWWYNNGNSQPAPATTTQKPTPTSTWTPPTSTYTPPPPTSTYTPPPATSTTTQQQAQNTPSTQAVVVASSADSSAASVAPSTSASLSSNGTLTNSTSSNPYVVSTNATATISSANPSSTNGSVPDAGNLALLSEAVINLGNIVVEGAKHS